MSQPSKELILELQEIIRDEYGRELSFAEATEAANNLVGFFDLLLKIDVRNKKVTNENRGKSWENQ